MMLSVNNGCGKNDFPALRGQKLEKLLTVKRLARQNNISLLEICPKSVYKDLGIAARFFEASPEIANFCMTFERNDSAEWIADQVKRTLKDLAAARAKEQLAEAVAAGFSSFVALQAARLAKALKKKRAKAKNTKAACLADTKTADQAFDEMRQLLQKYPDAARMSRKGQLIRADETKIGVNFTMIPEMRAWLHQHGFRASVDDRQHFFEAASRQA
jgi:hypothetical protein